MDGFIDSLRNKHEDLEAALNKETVYRKPQVAVSKRNASLNLLIVSKDFWKDRTFRELISRFPEQTLLGEKKHVIYIRFSY